MRGGGHDIAGYVNNTSQSDTSLYHQTLLSTIVRVVHLDVEVRSEELLTPALLCHKEPTSLCLPYAGSLWHKVAYNRTFQCMEATYPLCHKEPARSITMILSTNENTASTFLDQREWTRLCNTWDFES